MMKNTIEKTAENWLQKTGKEISVSTFLEYTGIVRRYIIPELGKLTWQEISQEDINTFTDKLLHNDGKAGRNLAPSTVLHVRTVLRQIAIFAHKTESAPQFVFSDRIPGAGRSPQDPEPLIAVGRVVGEITRAPRGSNGFGFDPVMFIPEFGQTFAELPTEVKNAHSHRGRAAQQMLALMRERWF